jgi:hypothetical protein
LARDQPEPGAVFGEPGPPILSGMGVVHACYVESGPKGGFCLPKAYLTGPP